MVSTATYQPGMVFSSDGQGHLIREPPQTYRLGGHFEANFLRYWWTYLEPRADGTLAGPFTWEQYGLEFTDVHLEGLDAVTGFVFPAYSVVISGTDVFGGSACNQPFPPDTYCSGYDLAGESRLRGQLEESRLLLQGWSALDASLLQGFEYDIYASPLPLPGTLGLVIGGLIGLGLVSTSRQARLS